MNKTLAALVLGVGALGAGCKNETGQIFNYSGAIYEAAEVKGWGYIHWEEGIYGRNPKSCEQLSSFPGKETFSFPVDGVKGDKVVSGEMCCLGHVHEGNFSPEYCVLLENKAEAQ